MEEIKEQAPLKIDRTKLLTISSYAKLVGVDRQTIYARERAGTIKTIKIDGVKFVELK